MEKLFSHIKLLNLNKRSQIVCAGEFNFFLNSELEVDGENPSLKIKSVREFYEISETLDLCDIWPVRYRDKKRFTFRQKHISGSIQED